MNIRWQKFSALGWLEWRVILASLAWLPWCALALRLQGFQRTRDTFLSRCALAQAGTPEGEQLALAQRIARAVNLAARYGPYRANCLKRSSLCFNSVAMVPIRRLSVTAMPSRISGSPAIATIPASCPTDRADGCELVKMVSGAK